MATLQAHSYYRQRRTVRAKGEEGRKEGTSQLFESAFVPDPSKHSQEPPLSRLPQGVDSPNMQPAGLITPICHFQRRSLRNTFLK